MEEKKGIQKRYYWLKLNEDFFQDPIIKKLRKIAGGDTFTCIYLKMMLMSLKSNGILIFEGFEESFEKELALKMDEDETNIKVVINYLFSYKLISEESKKNKSFLMTAVSKMTGTESESAERMRKLRAKSSQCDEQVTMSDAYVIHLENVSKNVPLSQCDSNVRLGDANVRTFNEDVMQCDTFDEKQYSIAKADRVDILVNASSQCDGNVRFSDEMVTTETRDKSCCSSLKDTTTTTKEIEPNLQKWLSFKSEGKNNPQGYEFTLLKKFEENESSVVLEYNAWLKDLVAKTTKNQMVELRGKTLLTQSGEKIILGIEKDVDDFKIYFKDGGYANVTTLNNLPIYNSKEY